MARGKSFSSLVTQIARDQARIQREHEREAREKQRNYERAQREASRFQAQMDKEAKLQYLESRIAETDEKNRQLSEYMGELAGILEHTLHFDDTISFDSLRINEPFRDFAIPLELQETPAPPQLEAFLSTVKKPGAMEKLIPGAKGRYQKALEEAENQFQLQQQQFQSYMADREKKIASLREQYEMEKNAFELKAQEHNHEVAEFETAYRNGDPDAITSYCAMVMERSNYPSDFPQEFRVAYVPEPKELVIEYELPGPGVVPAVAEYRYTKTKDTIDTKPRKATEIKALYQDIVASICIRTIHEIFEADQGDHIAVLAFNGITQTVDPATGHDIRPCLISIRTTKERFSEIQLARIDLRACLRNLGAQVSPRPDELLSVKPVVEFDMVDRRFVQQSDILSDLENRPNLMDLSPIEFENLVSNLFEKIGFQAKLTRASRDGGVDAIAFDPRPILGGKVVIQAKRYKNVVGVSAVRDLYGTMINEGASKGILVSTSHYGPDAYDFAKDKPIELIDGGGLLYLLEQQGIAARIILPED